jgi:hypothetical protein
MRSHQIFICLIVIVWLASCASPKNTTVSSSQGPTYSEDLSIWRPKVETPVDNTNTNVANAPKQTQYVEPKYAVNKKLDTVLDSIDRYNRARQFIDGFTIQIYAGLKREDALNAKKNLASSLPDLSSEVEYAQPNFRVKVLYLKTFFHEPSAKNQIAFWFLQHTYCFRSKAFACSP